MFASAGYAHTIRLVHADCPHKLVRRVQQRHTRFQSRATYSALRLNMWTINVMMCALNSPSVCLSYPEAGPSQDAARALSTSLPEQDETVARGLGQAAAASNPLVAAAGHVVVRV